MYNIYMLLNQKSKDSITFLLLLASLFWMKEINFLFYDSTQSQTSKNTLFILTTLQILILTFQENMVSCITIFTT